MHKSSLDVGSADEYSCQTLIIVEYIMYCTNGEITKSAAFEMLKKKRLFLMVRYKKVDC